jgi:mannose-6-phosphate isomerase
MIVLSNKIRGAFMTDKSPLYPLLFNPALHVKVWGGRRLASVLHKSLPTDEPYGESWELHDTATVANGPLAGRALGDLLAEYGHDLVGARNDPAEGFPLLVKFLDANDWLSVQVHPNDEQARQLEGEPRGKTESWIVIAAEPDAELVIGVQPGTTRQALADAIRTNTLEKLLVRAAAKTGSVLDMPAGTIHALGPGLLVYEIQQSSDTTYRLYDWGRMGLDGKPRPLHIEKSVQVANLERLPKIFTPQEPFPATFLVQTKYFVTQVYRVPNSGLALRERHDSPQTRRFHALTCLEGHVTIAATDAPPGVNVETGQTVLMPAAIADAYTLCGSGLLLCSRQP